MPRIWRHHVAIVLPCCSRLAILADVVTDVLRLINGLNNTQPSEAEAMQYEQSQLSRYLSMADTKVKRTKEKETIEKVEGGKCLMCGKCENGRRGLCTAHYFQFVRFKASLPKSERVAFEEEQIREGRILAVGQLREIRSPNVFAVHRTA